MLLGFNVQYPLSFITQNKDNMNRDFAVIEYALQNDKEKVYADSKRASGYVINCGEEPYLSICQQF